MITADWIAVDWGTSALRAWAMSGRRVEDAATSDKGMAGLSRDGFEPALLELIAPWLRDRPTRILACGMLGARDGWHEAPYHPVPARITADAAVWAPTEDSRLLVQIVPGLSQATPPDVMRGEETQIAGYLSQHPDFDGVLCLPGTHSKWVHLSAGEVVSFRTAMTGEIYQLLATQSVLSLAMDDGWEDAAFDAAIDETLSRPERLVGGIFGLRAAHLLSNPAPGAARAALSGAVIGAELAAMRAYWLGQPVALIGADALCHRYQRALAAQGVEATMAEGGAMACAGLAALFERMT